MILPDAKFSNMTISPNATATECLFIKVNGESKPVLKKIDGNWQINPDLKQ
jgi:hypothetical protein